MGLPRMRSPRGATSRRVALWSALAVGGILPSVGCQVEYAGMTLPSGKYMHDDVQYFPAGPEFPWANTQAATQRARMRAMGIEPPPPPVYGQAPAAGAINPIQNQFGRPTDINVSPLDTIPQLPPGGGPAPQPPAPGINAPGGNLMPPGNAAPPPAPGAAAGPRRRTGPAATAARCSPGPRARSAPALSHDNPEKVRDGTESLRPWRSEQKLAAPRLQA